MGYRVVRVSLHAVSRWSRSPGCCGYISWCVFLVSGGISFFFRFLYFERTRPTASTRQPCLMYLSTGNEARSGKRGDRGRFLPLGKKASSYRGAYRVPLLLVCVYMCVTFVVFTDCESCTMPISTNPRSMEAGEYGLTRGMCFFARRLEMVAVAGLLRLSWCVQGGVIFFVCFFFRPFFLRTHTAYCKYEGTS